MDVWLFFFYHNDHNGCDSFNSNQLWLTIEYLELFYAKYKMYQERTTPKKSVLHDWL